MYRHDSRGLGGDGRPKLVGGEAELILRLQLHIHRDGPRHLGQGAVADEGGGGHDDLVSGVQDDPHGQVDGLAAAHSDQDLPVVLIVEVKAALQVGGDLPAELEHTGVGGILGVAPLQGIDTRVTDVPGGNEVGLTDTQGDGIGHLLQNVEELADAGGLDALDLPV